MKCIGFSKNQVIEWDPDLLLPELLKFIENQNKKRKTPLCTASRKEKKEIIKELTQIIF